MLHATGDDGTVSSREAYASHHEPAVHVPQRLTSERPIAFQTTHHGIHNIHNFSPHAPGTFYSTGYDPGAYDWYANSEIALQQRQPQHVQPSFMRRPFRYQKRNAKERKPVQQPLGGATGKHVENPQWDSFGSPAPNFDTFTLKGIEPSGQNGDNMYADLYHYGRMNEFDPQAQLQDPAAVDPHVLSPPLDNEYEQSTHRSTSEDFVCALPSPQLTSPESIYTSPVTIADAVPSKPNSFLGRPGGIAKFKPKRLPRPRTNRKTEQSSPGFNLRADEMHTFEAIFERQFETMCRAVINEFNLNHETQIGPDLILQIIQQKDLMCFKRDQSF